MPLSLTGDANSWLVGSAGVLQKKKKRTSIDLRNSNPTSLLSSFAACKTLKEISFEISITRVTWLLHVKLTLLTGYFHPPHTHTPTHTKTNKRKNSKIQNNIIITTHVAVIISN
jgi:hypothetical protein